MISIYNRAKQYIRFKKTKPRGMSPKIVKRNKAIKKDWDAMIDKGLIPKQIIEKLSKKYDMKPDTLRTEYYRYVNWDDIVKISSD